VKEPIDQNKTTKSSHQISIYVSDQIHQNGSKQNFKELQLDRFMIAPKYFVGFT